MDEAPLPQSYANVLSRYAKLGELILKGSEKIESIEKALEAAKSERLRIEVGLFSPNNGHSQKICNEKIAAWEAECKGLRLELENYQEELRQINKRRYGLRPKYLPSYR